MDREEDKNYVSDKEQKKLQKEHLARLARANAFPDSERYQFKNPTELINELLQGPVGDLYHSQKSRTLPSNLPLSINELFTGRSDELDELDKFFSKGSTAAITGTALHGLGGVGKTRLALEYAHSKRQNYSATLFISVDPSEKSNDENTFDKAIDKLEFGLSELVNDGILNLPEKEARETSVRIHAALNWLDQNPTWLLILDNVDSVDAKRAIIDYLPKLKGGHVLITGRVDDYGPTISKLPLGVLKEEDAIEFLLKRTDEKRVKTKADEEDAKKLATEMGGLALGLEQASAYINKMRIGFKQYLKLWHENRKKALSLFNADDSAYNHDVGLAATWLTSIEQLSEHAVYLMSRIAFLAPDPIPVSVLENNLEGDPEGFDIFAARAELFELSLLQTNDEDGSFSMHRLVQGFWIGHMDEETQDVCLQNTKHWIAKAFVGHPHDVDNWPVLEPFVPHVEKLITRSEERNNLDGAVAYLMSTLGLLEQHKARYNQAEPLLKRTLEITEKEFGSENPEVATSLNNLARLLHDTNRLEEAEPLFKRALEITEKALGPEHPNVATRLNNLAMLLQRTNRLELAEPLFKRALEILINFQIKTSHEHPNFGRAIDNYVHLLIKLKMTEQQVEEKMAELGLQKGNGYE
ncbi:MAG: tetratricopeptide repeat protein [Nitratireductor sp.]